MPPLFNPTAAAVFLSNFEFLPAVLALICVWYYNKI